MTAILQPSIRGRRARAALLPTLAALVPAMLALWAPRAAASPPSDPALTVRQVTDAPALGLAPVAGLAYRPDAGRFVTAAPAALPNASAIAWDSRASRLLALDADARTLVAIPSDGRGGLDEARATRLEGLRAGLIRVAGMAVDPATGEVLVLDRLSRRIVRSTLGPGGLESASGAPIAVPGAPDVVGLAFDEAGRRLLTIDRRTRSVLAYAMDGREVGRYEIPGTDFLDPRGLALAPGSDRGRDPSSRSLYVFDAGGAATSGGRLLELAWPPRAAETLAATTTTAAAASLVRVTATSAWSPPSPDPSGITYDSVNNRLIVCDGEVEEMGIWAGKNVWEVSLSGVVSRSWSTTNFSVEPVGIAHNPNNGHVFVSDDDAQRVYDVNPGPDNLLGTSDDTRSSFSTLPLGCGDPEGCAYDRVNNRLFLCDGVGEEIFVVLPGPDGVFNGVAPSGDDQVTHFDTTQWGALDPETVEYKEETGTLLCVGRTNKTVLEFTIAGALVASTDISFAPLDNPAGLAYAPSSGDPTKKSYYIVNRVVDNDANPSENDGTLVEISVSDAPPGPGTDFRVLAGSDDAEEAAGGSMYLNSSDLELVYDGGNQTVGLRFGNVTIPRGATIATAWIQFAADETQSEATSLTIQGQSVDSAPTFTTAAQNVSSRPRTSASVTWAPAAWTNVGLAGPDQRTPELKSIVQEIVNRPGWTSGNAIAMVIRGTGHRTAIAYEGSTSGRPILHIETSEEPPPPGTNAAPGVNAGTDRTITLPSGASLDGTVSDDGLPDPPAAVTTAWSMTSGPGTVVFADPLAVDTQAAFTQAGSYVLRLTASDGELTAFDEVTVTVRTNTAPSVNAGIDRTVTLPSAVSLDATVTDDGYPVPPGAVTTAWSVTSGPGIVTFANELAVDTQASFTQAGSYVLRLTASDGELTAFDEATVTVQDPPPPGSSVVEKRIALKSDDAEENVATRAANVNSNDLELIRDGSVDQIVGLRFTGLAIPPGVTITNAWIQFTTDEAQTIATSLQIRGQAAGNPPTFAATTGNVSSRPRTTASVSWAPAAWSLVGEAGPNQRTPDLAPVIQEIVNRGDWASGNALVILVTGSGRRTAMAYPAGGTGTALLHVEY